MNANATAAAQGGDKGSTDLTPGLFNTTGDEGIAPVVASLQKVWARLQKAQPELPDATIVVKRDSRAWGHTTVQRVWGAQATKGRGKAKAAHLTAERYEVMVSGENLSRGAVAVLGTLLHEAAHALNLVRGVRDVDTNGRHNKRFKTTAEDAWGLDIRDLGNYAGWTDTYVPTATEARWAVEIRMIAAALAKSTVAHHPAPLKGAQGGSGGGTVVVLPPAPGTPGTTRTGGRAKNLTRALCACPADESGWRPSLRASARVLALGIRCDECGQLFS